eukprot:3129444-Lingulodinium_polyedra.AAC.1
MEVDAVQQTHNAQVRGPGHAQQGQVGQGAQPWKSLVCFACGGKGHRSRECPSRIERAQQVEPRSKGKGKGRGKGRRDEQAPPREATRDTVCFKCQKKGHFA